MNTGRGLAGLGRGVRMEGDRLLVRPELGTRHHLSPLISWQLSHAQVRAASHQVIRTEPGDAAADIKQLCSGFHPESLRVSGCVPQPLGSATGVGTLTLSADGPLPAFFADTCEGLAVDYTGAPVMAGVRQAATISGYKTRADKTTFPEDPQTV